MQTQPNPPASTLGAEIFREYELHVPDVVPRPQRLEDEVGEAEDGEILNQFLAQVMVDPAGRLLQLYCSFPRVQYVQDRVMHGRRRRHLPEYLLLDQVLLQGPSELAGGLRVTAEWLLHYKSCPPA